MNNSMENRKVLTYAGMLCGGFGAMPLFMLISAFLTFFYTDVVGVNPAAVGTIILISKFFDGISDIIFGNMIDNTRKESGVCRPWILRCAILIAIAIVCIFTVPNVGNTGKLVYIFISYNFSQTFVYTITLVALMGLPTYITRDSKIQSVMFTLSNVGQGVMATVVSSVTLNIVQKLGGDQKSWIIVGAGFGVMCMVFLLITYALCKENTELLDLKENAANGDSTPQYSLLQILKSILLNKYWLIALAIAVLGASLNSAHLTLTSYYARYILGDITKASVINGATTFPGIFASFLCIPLLVKCSKRTSMLCSVFLILVGSLVVLVSPASMTILIISSVILSLGISMSIPITNSMLGNIIEYGEWKTGIRSQAALMGANSAGQKIGQGVITAVFSWIMTMTGYDGTATVQTETALSGISNLFIFLPIVLSVVMFIMIYFYDLDKKYPVIMKELEERRNLQK